MENIIEIFIPAASPAGVIEMSTCLRGEIMPGFLNEKE